MVLWLRRTGKLSLDDLLEAAQAVLPHLRRSSLHRLLVRQGCSRLPSQAQQPTGQPGTFKQYGPGYLHLDCFYLTQLEGQKHYCFVALPRGHPTAPPAWFIWGCTSTRTRRPPPTS